MVLVSIVMNTEKFINITLIKISGQILQFPFVLVATIKLTISLWFSSGQEHMKSIKNGLRNKKQKEDIYRLEKK